MKKPNKASPKDEHLRTSRIPRHHFIATQTPSWETWTFLIFPKKPQQKSEAHAKQKPWVRPNVYVHAKPRKKQQTNRQTKKCRENLPNPSKHHYLSPKTSQKKKNNNLLAPRSAPFRRRLVRVAPCRHGAGIGCGDPRGLWDESWAFEAVGFSRQRHPEHPKKHWKPQKKPRVWNNKNTFVFFSVVLWLKCFGGFLTGL